MAKQTKESKLKMDEAGNVFDGSKNSKTYQSVLSHYNSSWQDLVQHQVDGWREKEAMLLGRTLDSITGIETNSGVFDPRLATISIERCGRVMAQNPSGKPLAMSSNDRGKNMLMNLLIDKWVLPNANSQYSFLIKCRLWDLYADMYGVMFALADRVDTDLYSGPDMWLLPIRHCRPQPGRFSLKECDWFGVSTWVTKEWLRSRNREVWQNVDKLLTKMEGTSSDAGDKDSNERTYIEQDRQPTVSKPKDYKTIELYTEYRKDRWITICPDFKDDELLLRDIGNPHKSNELPIKAKYCFPLMDSIYGLGEFERGKTLQFALNSLWNLYLDGVKMSIFPPIQMVADDIVPSSIVMEPAAKWMLTKSGAEIKTFNASPQGINTFQNTYQFLIAAIQNQAGTTDTTVSSTTDLSQGKTPTALKLQAAREGTRDAWDRFMMEEALEDLMKTFVNLTATGLSKQVELRLFAPEIEEIAKVAPDVVELVDGDERGAVKINKSTFKDTRFDYQITKGSTYKADQEKEQENLTSILNFTLQNYQVLEPEFEKKGKKIDITELYQRSLIVSGTQDWDKIITDLTPQDMQAIQAAKEAQMQAAQAASMQQVGPGQGGDVQSQLDQMAQQVGGGQPQQGQEMAPMPPMPSMSEMGQQGSVQQPVNGPLSGQFRDPAIAQLASQLFGGQ